MNEKEDLEVLKKEKEEELSVKVGRGYRCKQCGKVENFTLDEA